MTRMVGEKQKIYSYKVGPRIQLSMGFFQPLEMTENKGVTGVMTLLLRPHNPIYN